MEAGGVQRAAAVPPPRQAAPDPRLFLHRRYHFTTGVRAGQTAAIRDDAGAPILTYRSFASIVGIVAILVSTIVALAGLAAVAFLAAEEELLRAAAVALLTTAFAFFIALLVPQIQVTLYTEAGPALTIRQERSFPIACYAVTLPDGSGGGTAAAFCTLSAVAPRPSALGSRPSVASGSVGGS